MPVIKKLKFKHSKQLPSNLMGIMCGRTGAGKTHLLFKMLTTPGMLDFNNLIIVTTTPEQEYYQFLKYGFDNNLDKLTIYKSYEYYIENEDDDIDIEELCIEASKTEQSTTSKNSISCLLTSDPTTIEDFTKLNKKKNLIIFDDYMTRKDQSIPQMMYTSGRHNNCAAIYLAQSFHTIDALIRKNSNLFILFETNDRNLTELLKDISVGDKTEFKKCVKRIWQKNYNYITINLDKPLSERYFGEEKLSLNK